MGIYAIWEMAQPPKISGRPPVRALRRGDGSTPPGDPTRQSGDKAPAATCSAEERLEIFTRLFRGRPDVYAVRWENASRGTSGYMPDCSNKFVRPLCNIRTTKCSRCPNQAFKPLNKEAIERHLRGHHTIGVYPLLKDGTCWFLALDFDEQTWRRDVSAVRDAATSLELPVYVERSRSGKGAHLWLFFDEPISAKGARTLGGMLIARARELRPSVVLRSYDRMFPSQDSVAQGGLGNLIAVPLQRGPRKLGNSVFVDDDLEPYSHEQQWTVLASVTRVCPKKVAATLAGATEHQRPKLRSSSPPVGQTLELFARSDIDAVEDPKRERSVPGELALSTLRFRVRERIYVERAQLPDRVQSRIRKLAEFSNPEFFRKKAARLSTWNTPPVIRCSEVLENEIALPRGTEQELRGVASALGIEVNCQEEREPGTRLDVVFQGSLTSVQNDALEALSAHDMGILVLPPGMGKTVVATALLARRGTSTLVIVNRRALVEQWRAQLSAFLGIPESSVGKLTGDRSHPTGEIDIATMQFLARGEHGEALAQYGHVIVDECHHCASPSFERVLRTIPARSILGLTATPKRRDGHHPIMHMQLGPIRFEISARLAAAWRPFVHRYFVRPTEFVLPAFSEELTELQSHLAQDERRNSFILDDAVAALREGRSPLLLCQRREHVLQLAGRLGRYVKNQFVLMGGMTARQRQATFAALRALDSGEQRLVVATGSYIGEGFDDARLDTLLLVAPISWKGTLAQYVGRLHRQHPDKREVWIFDYADKAVPRLARMFEKRQTGYRALGYVEGDPPHEFELLTDPGADVEAYWESFEPSVHRRRRAAH